MHEWALAEAVVEYVRRVAGGGAIAKLTLGLGELQAIDEEVFKFALRELFKEYGIEVRELRIEHEECLLKCRACGHVWRLKDANLEEDVREAIHFVPEVIHSYLRCPKCGSRDFEVIGGRGVSVKEVVKA